MLIPYIRSSLVGAVAWCPFKAYLVYTLGLGENENFKARKGTLVHKAMELLAKAKFAHQEEEGSFFDDDCHKEFQADKMTPKIALDVAWDLSVSQRPDFPWSDDDYDDCKKWMSNILSHPGGSYDPRNRQIFAVEKFFDLPCKFSDEESSRKWKFTDKDGKVHEGEIRLRGTMDLLCEVEGKPNTEVLEYIDYKTGKHRVDWATGKEKGLDAFKDDFQLLFYFSAIMKSYPTLKAVLMTLFYAQSGGPFTVVFGREDLPRAEEKIREFLERVSRDSSPERILGNPRRTKELFKCTRLCDFYKENELGDNACNFHYRELQQLGMKEHTKKYADVSKFSTYTGGGKTNKQVEVKDQ